METHAFVLPAVIQALPVLGPALDAAGVGLALVDPCGRVLQSNTVMARLLETAPEPGVDPIDQLTRLGYLLELPFYVNVGHFKSRRKMLGPYRVVISTQHADVEHGEPDLDLAGVDESRQSPAIDHPREPGSPSLEGGTSFARPSPVSKREWEIVLGLLAYRSLPEVASDLEMSVHTARNHLKSIFRKMHVSSQHALLRLVAGLEPE